MSPLVAYLIGAATGASVVLLTVARQRARSQRDRAAVAQHLAMVRAMRSFGAGSPR